MEDFTTRINVFSSTMSRTTAPSILVMRPMMPALVTTSIPSFKLSINASCSFWRLAWGRIRKKYMTTGMRNKGQEDWRKEPPAGAACKKIIVEKLCRSGWMCWWIGILMDWDADRHLLGDLGQQIMPHCKQDAQK